MQKPIVIVIFLRYARILTVIVIGKSIVPSITALVRIQKHAKILTAGVGDLKSELKPTINPSDITIGLGGK